ncbi:MAG TPA: DUF1592 domain-containing protein [Polyangia bacterium]|jgi:hypothetical protein|nr:DUF1592 domain-containing protein [Polyangia bacterium]
MAKKFLGLTVAGVAAFVAAGCSGSIADSSNPGDRGGVTTPPDTGGQVTPPPTPTPCMADASLAAARIWRLTDEQYVNVVAQVFGVRVPSSITEAETAPADFTATAESPELTVQANTVNAYATAAQTAAAAAVHANLNVFLPSSATAPPGTEVELFIRNRVARAFGRPVTEGEVSDLLGIYHTGLSTESAAAGIRLVIEATLQSPSFLYRTELGTTMSGKKTALTAHELATAVSFALLDSVPDDQLWAKAESSALLKPAVLAAEVDRLLADPAVQANLGQKAGYWLGVEKIRSMVPRNATAFPDFDATMTQDLYKSGELFVTDLMARGTVAQLLTSDTLYANAGVAKLYGLAGVSGTDLTPVHAGSDRAAGIITQPGILAAWSQPSSDGDANRGDVIHRGLFIYNALVCGISIGQPPDNAAAVASTFPPTATEREKAQLRATAKEGCGACHGLFDPLGLATEQYDPVGRYTPKDTSGQVIDASSTLAHLGPDLDGPISGLPDLVNKLKMGRRVSDCAVKNLSKPTIGRDDLLNDNSCDLQKVKDKLAATGSFTDYYRAVFTSPGFLTRDLTP